jgi:hypothetical protein
MPFGLDLKSMIVGALIAYFLVPRVIGLVSSVRGGNTAAA